MKTILFNNYGASPGVKFTKDFKESLASIFKNEEVYFKRISYVFCTDDYLLTLNRQYLNHDTFTDIITFILSEPGTDIEAEIYISIKRVTENSANLKIKYEIELERVMIHGILHLCGYLDATPKQKAVMRKKEDFYLQRIGST